jgi:hypothetical protein
VNNNEWLDIDVLEDYLDGKLDAKTMHRVERLSLEDPFVAEALAGLSLSPKRTQSLSLLQKQLQERIAQKPVEVKRWQITSQRLSIAAAAAVLFITVSLLFWMRESNNREKIAANTPRKVEVAIARRKKPTQPIVKSADQVEKVISEAGLDKYVVNSRKITKQASSPAVVPNPIVVDSEPAASDLVAATPVEAKQRNEVSSVLKAKVAGLSMYPKNAIQGVVYDEDKRPIPGATVKLNGTSQSARTDSKGQFNLALDSLLKNPTLKVAYLGFMPKEIPVKKDENIAIELKPTGESLNEVVITSGQVTRDGPSVYPQPVGGLDKFEDYAINNNKLLYEKKLTGRYVSLSFEVDKDGNPIKIEVIKRYDTIPLQTEAEEKEAIRLVKEGPKWILPKNSSFSTNQVFVKIRF